MSCLNTLENFREKADENNISYLKSKNVFKSIDWFGKQG